jgi:hypothetical protein
MRAGYRSLLAASAVQAISAAQASSLLFQMVAPGLTVAGYGGAFASPFRRRRHKRNARRQRGRKTCPPFCRGRA